MCLFCDIVLGKIPSNIVYENDNVLAFLDIAPVNYGHVLVIPKKHYQNIEEIPEEELCEVIKAVKKIGRGVKTGLGTEAYNIQENNDPAAGQIIPHLHFHIVPRKEGDGLKLWPGGKYADGEIEEALTKIKEAIK